MKEDLTLILLTIAMFIFALCQAGERFVRGERLYPTNEDEFI